MNDDKSPVVDPWCELRVLNDLDLGVLAHRAGPHLESMRQALPVTVNMRRSAGQETPGEWGEAFAIVARDGARIRAALPPPPDAELDALSTYLGQPRGRLLEGAQRLVDHNNELRVSREQERRAVSGATTALLNVGSSLEVVGTGKPWAEIGKAGVAAVNLLQAHLKTARQGWADESAAACRARVERDKSRAECATLTEQVRSRGATIASLRADLVAAQDTAGGWMAKHDVVAADVQQAERRAEGFEREVADLRGRLAEAEGALTATRSDLALAKSVRDAFATRLQATEKLADWWKARYLQHEGVVRPEDLDSHRLPSTSTHARPHSMATDSAGVHLGFMLPSAGGLAIRLTCDEAVRLRGWLVNAAGLPGIEPRVLGGPLQAVGPGPRLVRPPRTAGRSVAEGLTRDPSTGTYTLTAGDLKVWASAPVVEGTPTPAADAALDRAMLAEALDAARKGEVWRPDLAAKSSPLRDFHAVLARAPEVCEIPANDPRFAVRSVMAACNLYAAGWRADRSIAAAHRALDWGKRQRQLAQEAFSDGVVAGMGVDDLTRAA